MARTITLTQGKVAVVDDQDYERLSRHRWYAAQFGKSETYYAVRGRKKAEGKPGIVFMHREVLGLADPKVYADHKNRDGLDNQRHNLRACSNSRNQANSRKQAGTTSRYKGVSWDTKARRWVAQIWTGGTNRRLGYHAVEEDAARAYDAAAEELWGEFANLNRKSFTLIGRAA